MIIWIFLCFQWFTHSDSLSQNVLRLKAFHEHMLKKEDLEKRREAAIGKFKEKKAAAQVNYETARDHYKRPQIPPPLGFAIYDKRYAELAKIQEHRQEQYIKKKKVPSPVLEKKLDEIKMQEYSLGKK